MPTSSALLAGLGLAASVLLVGCGADAPATLEPVRPAAPADLCSLVPASVRGDLVTSSTTDEAGEPTAACALHSPEGSRDGVRALVTWVQLDDEPTAEQVYDSQCRAVDTTRLRTRSGFSADGAERACAAVGRPGGEGSATMSALAARDVVTVRLTSATGSADAVGRQAQQVLEDVVRGLTAGS